MCQPGASARGDVRPPRQVSKNKETNNKQQTNNNNDDSFIYLPFIVVRSREIILLLLRAATGKQSVVIVLQIIMRNGGAHMNEWRRMKSYRRLPLSWQLAWFFFIICRRPLYATKKDFAFVGDSQCNERTTAIGGVGNTSNSTMRRLLLDSLNRRESCDI